MDTLESKEANLRGSHTRSSTSAEKLIAIVGDAGSAEVIRNVVLDRAIPTAHVARGTLGDAIALLKTERESPTHLIVDVSECVMPTTDLRQLSDAVDPSVVVVVVGERNDVELFRSLLHLGVQDYLVKPLTVEQVRRAMTSSDPTANGRIGKAVSFVGARGGVGVTTIATALARHLADTTRRRIAYVDLDPYGSAAASMLGVANPNGLIELLQNTRRLDQQLINHAFVARGDRLFTLASELAYNHDCALPSGALTELIAALKRHFHYVILDLPQRGGPLTEEALNVSATIHVVADHSVHATREAARLCRFASSRDTDPAIVVLLNEARQPVEGRVKTGDFVSALARGPVRTLPYEPHTLALTENLGEVVGNPKRSAFARAIVSLANEVTGSTAPEPATARWYMRLLAKGRAN